jgi:hypothetical protein
MGYAGDGGDDAFALARGSRAYDADALAEELERAGILPAGGPPERRAEIAASVAAELQASEQRWTELGRAKSGQQAVDDSRYLAELVRGSASSGGSLVELFTRRVADKTFVLRRGVWVDQALGEGAAATRVVEAFSSEYFALLAARPALAPYLAFSSRLIVSAGGEVIEIVESRSTAGPAR